jgi:hypothetical protein
MTLRWFRFSAPGVDDQYGYGTEAEADEYARELPPEYSASPLSATTPVNVDGIAFSIREALAVLHKRQDAWRPQQSAFGRR